MRTGNICTCSFSQREVTVNLQVLGKIFFRSFVLIRIRIVSLHRKDIVKFYHNKLLLGVKEVVVSFNQC